MSAREHWMYRAYDESGVLLYVGVTKNLRTRRASHRSTSPWFESATRFVLTGPLDRESAYLLEAKTIRDLAPLHNRNHRKGRSLALVPTPRREHRSSILLVGPALRAIRERSGISVAELARGIGRNAAYVSRLELGQRQPSPATLRAICDLLRVSIDQVTNLPTEKAA